MSSKQKTKSSSVKEKEKDIVVSFASDSEDDDVKTSTPLTSSEDEQPKSSSFSQEVKNEATPDEEEIETVTFTLTLSNATNSGSNIDDVIHSEETTNEASENKIVKLAEVPSQKLSKTTVDVQNDKELSSAVAEDVADNDDSLLEAATSSNKSRKLAVKSIKRDVVNDIGEADVKTRSKSSKFAAANSEDRVDKTKKDVPVPGSTDDVTVTKKKKQPKTTVLPSDDDVASHDHIIKVAEKVSSKKKTKQNTEQSVETKSGGEAVEKANIATSKNCEIVSGSTTELPNNTDNVEAKSEEKDEKPKKKKSVSRKLDAVSCEDRTSTDDITQEPSSKITVIKKKKLKKAAPSTVSVPAAVSETDVDLRNPDSRDLNVDLQVKEERHIDVIDVKKMNEIEETSVTETSCGSLTVDVTSSTCELFEMSNTVSAIKEGIEGDVLMKAEANYSEEADKEVKHNNDMTDTGSVQGDDKTVNMLLNSSVQGCVIGVPDEITSGDSIVRITEHVNDHSNKDYLNVNEPANSAVDGATDESTMLKENEESGLSYRRKSMDDFIKRILAEAREEQQKRMTVLTPENKLTDTNDENQVRKSLNVSEQPWSHVEKDSSLLDRRLALPDRIRLLNGEPTRNESGENDLDEDLAEIGRYFTKCSQVMSNKYDVSVDDSNELTSGRRLASRQFTGDDDDMSVTKKTCLVEDNYIGYRKDQQQRNGFSEDSFIPRSRDETADIVRSSTRPVRAIIDQQADVIQQLKSTARNMDDLEAEVRSLRETFLDRQARIDTLRSSIDAEFRLYESDQNAANERLQQHKIPGGRFVREEFMASFGSSRVIQSDGPSVSDDTTSFRRRSGSMSSTSAIGPGLTSGDLDYRHNLLSKPFTSRQPVISWRRSDIDDDSSSTASGYSSARSRRDGSAARDRTYTIDELLGSGSRPNNARIMQPSKFTSNDMTGPLYTSSSLTNPDVSTGGRDTTTLSLLSMNHYSSSAGSYVANPETRSYLLTDYKPTAFSSAQNSSSGSTGYSGYGGSLSMTADPSRFRRAQSVSDVSYERFSNYDRNSSFISMPNSSEFQSRFLDKVRNKKALGDDTQRAGDRQFKSRFLRNTYDNDVRKYSSGSGIRSHTD